MAVSEDRVRALQRRAVVVDGHADTLWRVLDEGADITVRSSSGHIDVPRLLEGGVDAQVFSLWASSAYEEQEYIRRCLRLIDALHRTIGRGGGRIFLATTPDDIRRADREGRVAALMGIEGGHAIGSDLAVLRMFQRMGVRLMTLTWSIHTPWADSSSGRPAAHGLTAFGVKVVEEMNRMGMIVDVSHLSDDTFRDVLAASRAPVVASHSCCRALCDVPRNLDDEMLRALAKNGGVVMINFYPAFLDPAFGNAVDAAEASMREQFKAAAAEATFDPIAREARMWDLHRRAQAGVEPPPLDRVLDHIDHVVEVAGVDHVGLGSDFDGITRTPRGLEDVTKVPSITRGLIERGYTDEEVMKILGGNFMRVFDQVTRIAADR